MTKKKKSHQPVPHLAKTTNEAIPKLVRLSAAGEPGFLVLIKCGEDTLAVPREVLEEVAALAQIGLVQKTTGKDIPSDDMAKLLQLNHELMDRAERMLAKVEEIAQR